MGEPVHGITATSNRERCWGPKQVKKMTEVKATMRQRARAIGIATAIALLTAAIAGTGTSVAAKAPAAFYGVVPQTHLDRQRLRAHGHRQGRLRAPDHELGGDRPDPAGRQRLVVVRPARARGGGERDRGAAVRLRHARLGRQRHRQPELQRRQVRHLRAEGQRGAGRVVDVRRPRRSTATGPTASSGPRIRRCRTSPIVDWQLWNEQNSKTFFAPKPSAKAYAKLLKAGHDAIAQRRPRRRRDPRRDGGAGGLAQGDPGLRVPRASSTTSGASRTTSTAVAPASVRRDDREGRPRRSRSTAR